MLLQQLRWGRVADPLAVRTSWRRFELALFVFDEGAGHGGVEDFASEERGATDALNAVNAWCSQARTLAQAHKRHRQCTVRCSSWECSGQGVWEVVSIR